MDECEESYGTLLFFRKDGQAGTPYSFCIGKTTIGASRDADIRLKLNNRDLKPIHCIIDVNEYGIATIVNKSASPPVKVNGNFVRIAKVLNHCDEIEVVGKKFQYLNEDLSTEDTEKCEQILREVIASPVKKRHSVVPLVKGGNKTPSLKTKTPVRRPLSSRESFSGCNSEFTATVTPKKRLGRRSLLEKCQTTSKVIVSKALGSPKPSKIRRLSLGSQPSSDKSSKVSARNVLLSESTISSTTSENDELTFMKPSQTMDDIEEVKEAEFLNESNITIDVELEDNTPVRNMSLNTPSRSSVKIIVKEVTPQADTPFSKKVAILRTPRSSVSKRISGFNSPKERLATPSNREASHEFGEKNKSISDKSEGSAYKRHSKLECLSSNNTPRFSKGTKRRLSSLDDQDLSSQSVRLNLSSSSTISPIKNFSRNSMGLLSTGDKSSPRKSLLRKSLRKSQLVQEQLALAEMSARKSSGRSRVRSTSGDRKSENLQRRNSGTEEEKNISSSSDSVFEEFSPSKHRQISRKSNSAGEKSRSFRRNSDSDQFSSEKSFTHSDALDVSSVSSDSFNLSPINSSIKHSFNKKEPRESLDMEIKTKTRVSTGKSLSFREEPSDYADKSSRKSRQSIRNSKLPKEDIEGKDTQPLGVDSVQEQADSSVKSIRNSIDDKNETTEPEIRKSGRKRSTPYRYSLDKSSVKDISNLSSIASPILKCVSPFTPRHSILKKSMRKSEAGEETELSFKKESVDIGESLIRSRQSSAKKSKIGVSSAESSGRLSSTRSRILLEESQPLMDESVVDDFVNKGHRKTMRKSERSLDGKVEKEMSLIEIKDDSSYSTRRSKNMSNAKGLITDCSSKKSSRRSTRGNLSPDKSLMDSKTSLVENQFDGDLSSEEDFELVLSDGSKGDSSSENSMITLNSTVQEELELETPKSALKNRRSKSTPYVPVTEEITPVSPIAKGKIEGGFKTPLNTPGLFENIRKSVLKSRSRTRRSSSSFMEELNKADSRTKAVKRLRESTDSLGKSTKRRKVNGRSQESFGGDSEDFESSFDSFRTEDILSDISDQNVLQTPKHFSNLTDKPVVNIPRTRSLTEPRNNKTAPTRRSLHAVRLESQLTATTGSDIISSTSFSSENSDNVFEISSDSDAGLKSVEVEEAKQTRKKKQKSPKNDLSDVAGLKKLLRTPRQLNSPKNDLSDVRGVKNILRTPKTINTPKNDLRNIPNLRKFMSPKAVATPKNDLENIVSFKKLLKTPREVKAPKNDLTDVKGVKKLLRTPRMINSPKNDLTDVRGVKNLLGTPKTINSPKNDLTNIPSLRNLMSPKTVKSPENDLRNVVSFKRLFETPKVVKSPKNDLRNVAGVKKLLSTPTVQNSPKNDLTNVPNLRRIMSPKQQNGPRNDLTSVHGVKQLMKTPKKMKEPVNDLSNVEGVANIFNVSVSNESDIENNENLFDKLFLKKPLKTYRGRSMSPTTRKAMLYKGDRKTMGDTPLSSPRVEKWVEEQAIMKSKIDDEVFEKISVQENNTPKKPSRKQERAEEIQKIETDKVESPRRPLRGRRKKEKSLSDPVDVDVIVSPKIRPRRQAEAKHVEKPSEIAEKVVLAKRTLRGRRNAEEQQEVKEPEIVEIVEADKVEPKGKTKRGRKNVEEKSKENQPLEIVKTEEVCKVESPKRTLRGRRNVEEKQLSEVTETNDLVNHPPEVINVPKTTRGRKKVVKTDDELSNEVNSAQTSKPAEAKRGRSKKVAYKQDDQVAEVDSTTASPAPRRGRTRVVAVVEEVDESSDTEIVSVAPKRGVLRNATKEEESAPAGKAPAKRRRGKVQETPKVDDEQKNELKESESEEQVPAEPEHPVKKRGRPKATKATKQLELDPASEKATTKRTRKVAVEEIASVDSPRTRAKKGDFNKYGEEFVVESPRLDSRTKKKVQFKDEIEDDQVKTRKRRGRNVETEVEETTRKSKRTRK